VSIGEIYQQSNSRTPILFITSPGADPSQELRDVAIKHVGTDHFYQVAMGQGQSDIALQCIRTCAEKGGWVCLQNIHLVIHWVAILEKELDSLKLDPNFRLWITTEPHLKFPASFLKKCVKITTESPPGEFECTKMKVSKRIWKEFTKPGVQSIWRKDRFFVLKPYLH